MLQNKLMKNRHSALAIMAMFAWLWCAACSGEYEKSAAKEKPAAELQAKLVYYALPG